MIGFGQNVNQIELFDKNQKKHTIIPSYNLLTNFCLETKNIYLDKSNEFFFEGSWECGEWMFVISECFEDNDHKEVLISKRIYNASTSSNYTELYLYHNGYVSFCLLNSISSS